MSVGENKHQNDIGKKKREGEWKNVDKAKKGSKTCTHNEFMIDKKQNKCLESIFLCSIKPEAEKHIELCAGKNKI